MFGVHLVYNHINNKTNNLMNVFIKAIINGNNIYIKVNKELLLELFDVLHDNGYRIEVVLPVIWDENIHYGLSYEIDSEEELEEFKNINLRVKALQDEKGITTT